MTTPCKLMYDSLSSGFRLIWPSPETRPFGKEKEKHTKKHTITPPPPQPSFLQIKCVFQGRNNSGSSPMTLCAQLSERITWFIYSLECCNRIIIFCFFSFAVFDLYGAASEAGRGMTSTMESGSFDPSPQFAVKSAKAALFSTETRTDFFLKNFNVRQEQTRTSSPFGTYIVICSQRNFINHLWSS